MFKGLSTTTTTTTNTAANTANTANMRGKFLLLLSAVGFLVIAVLVYVQVQKSRVVATQSTVLSVLAALQRASSIELVSTTEWRTIGDDEYGRIIKEISQSASIDTGTNSWQNGTLIDSWGKRFQIAVRKAEHGFEFIVWSMGPDGVSKTGDDIKAPSDVRVP